MLSKTQIDHIKNLCRTHNAAIYTRETVHENRMRYIY